MAVLNNCANQASAASCPGNLSGEWQPVVGYEQSLMSWGGSAASMAVNSNLRKGSSRACHSCQSKELTVPAQLTISSSRPSKAPLRFAFAVG